VIDLFTLALTHGLILLALWRLMARPELDAEAPPSRAKPWVKERHGAPEEVAGDA